MRRYVSPDDVWRVVEKVRQHRLGTLVRRLVQPSASARVRHAWSAAPAGVRQWTGIPHVQQRLNARATGNPRTSVAAYVAEKYLSAGGHRGISVACGAGANEVRWAETGCFARIDGFDISPARIEAARQRAQAAGLAHVLHFHVADVRSVPLPPEAYTVLLAEGALHHLSPLAPAVARLRAALAPGGLVVLRDFVGPARFQWTRAQVAAADALLAALPEAYRTRAASGTVKRRIWTPGLLAMRLSDPSEAAESDRIPAVLAAHVHTLETRSLGGDVLHLAFDEIAHHFTAPDSARLYWLEQAFAHEDAYLAARPGAGDFLFGVYRKAHA